jgi:protein-disulfide isomerase
MLKVPVTAGDHVQGELATALVTLVEYGDYECPHCGRAYPIVKEVQRHFGARVAFVFRNFPLSEIHPNAEAAAEAAEFAAASGRFWEMHDALFENQANLGRPLLRRLCDALGLPQESLELALADKQYAERVRADFLGGVRSGVNGTPTFFIDGHRHEGPFDYEDLVKAIDARLATT